MDKAIILLLSLQVLFRSSFLDDRLLPYLDVGGTTSLGLNDLSFFLLILITFVKLTTESKNALIWTIPNRFFALFMLIGLIGFVNAATGETGFHLAGKEARYFFVYLIFFSVLALDYNEKNIKYITQSIIVLALVTAIFSVLQVVVGERIAFLFGKVSTLNTLDSDVEGITRVGSGGLATINLAFFVILSVMLIKITNKNILLLLVLFAALFVSFNRGTWVSIILALIVIMPFIGKELRLKSIKIMSVLGVLMAAIFVFGIWGVLGGKVQGYAEAGVARFSSLLPGQIENDGSTMDRFKEADTVFTKYLNKPIMGYGLGAVTQDRMVVRGEQGEKVKQESWGYVHNGYLYVLFKLGAVGLIVFLVMIFSFVYRGLVALKSMPESKEKTYYVGYLMFVVSMVPHSIVSPRIMEGKYITVIAISMGMIELIRRYLLNNDYSHQEESQELSSGMVDVKKGKYESVRLR